ncbi:MAG: 2-dehydropantoate 2-reductase [Sphingomonadales bacterium]|nr:2-dehydropantoate 2-reductase [Sphingomonadales bacterium]MDE2568616.1 2-dehydropantoate 2-reductase [Sphingomonadales bacterium]
MKHVTIVGAGAMGCLFGARLAEAGAEVTLVDVDAGRVAVLAKDGVLLHDDAGERRVALNAALAADAGPADLVLFFTKGMHTTAAARSVAHLAQGGAVALTLQNGLGNAEAIAEVFAPERVLMGVTDVPGDLEPPNHVSSHGSGKVVIGGLVPEAQAHAEAAGALLDKAGWQVVVDPQVQVAVWEKAGFNAALNAISTILRVPVGGMDNAPCRRVASAVLDEVCAAAKARGLELDRERLDSRVDFGLANHKAHKPSMLQDRLAGRPTEVETINGAIVRLAAEVGVATPVTQALADLVRAGEVQGSGA